MFYFSGVNNLTELQERRIKLLQRSPDEAARINSEFMQAKDAIIGKRNLGCIGEQQRAFCVATSPGCMGEFRVSGTTCPAVEQPRKRLPRMTYRVELVSDVKTYVELRGDCIYVSPPPYQAFNAEYLNNQIELPKVETPATMAFFIPPLTDVPIYCFT